MKEKINLKDKNREIEINFQNLNNKVENIKVTTLFSTDIVGESIFFAFDENKEIFSFKYNEEKDLYMPLENDEIEIAEDILNDFIDENKENFYLENEKINIFDFFNFEEIEE
ncbi:hypothetical protein [Mesomycoplasma molare]|uniref:DUF1292 domain-containing protein n=1 Tax=Mesomycoplasma molare TaxID=171288 RepID=A0ABY5TVC0_9BACT|nr:hypothetical protein [Mesomycoplasma molare]UWD33961.1 hypothetical protein NX772_02530 [Mesomycoplasma molare]